MIMGDGERDNDGDGDGDGDGDVDGVGEGMGIGMVVVVGMALRTNSPFCNAGEAAKLWFWRTNQNRMNTAVYSNLARQC